MTARSIAAALLRALGVIVASIVALVAILYLVLTIPPVLNLATRLLSVPLEATTGMRIVVGSLATDFHSYVRLGAVRVQLGDGGTSVVAGRISARFRLLDLIAGRLGSVDRVILENLVVTVPPGPKDTTAFTWSIDPYVAYVPRRTEVRNARILLVSPIVSPRDSSVTWDTTAVTIVDGSLIAVAAGGDSSLAAVLKVAGTFDADTLGIIPLRIGSRLYFDGPEVNAENLAIRGPGIRVDGSFGARDLAIGPYEADIRGRANLSLLPSRASGLDLRGLVALDGRVRYDDRLRADVTLRADDMSTPWVNLVATRFHVDTIAEDSLLVADGHAELAGGALDFQARAPQPPFAGPYILEVVANNFVLTEVAEIPALDGALDSLAPRGAMDIVARSEGWIDEWTGKGIRAIESRIELAGRDLDVADIPIGPLALEITQKNRHVSGSIDMLDSYIAFEGVADSIQSVALRATLDAPYLDTLLAPFGVAGFGGGLEAEALITGSLEAPDVHATAHTTGLVIPGVTPGDFRIAAHLTPSLQLTADVASLDTLIEAHAVLVESFSRFAELRIHFGPLPTSRIGGDLEESYGLVGTIYANASGSGPVAAPRLVADIGTSELSMGGRSLGVLSATAELDSGWVQFAGGLDDESVRFSGWVPLDSTRRATIRARWDDFALAGIIAGLAGRDSALVEAWTSGRVSATWIAARPDSFAVRGTLSRLDLDLADVIYRIENPPGEFSYTAGGFRLEPLALVGDGQRLYATGRMTVDGALDFAVRADEIDLRHVGRVAGVPDLRGIVNLRASVGGTTERPEGSAILRIDRASYGAFRMDTLGVTARLANDTLSVPDLFARIGAGSLRGRFFATAPALGMTASTEVDSLFHLELDIDSVGTNVENWENLHPGSIGLSGTVDLEGESIVDPTTWEGLIRVDSLDVSAPYERSLLSDRSFAITFSDRGAAFDDSVLITLWYNRRPSGRISLSHPSDSASTLNVDVRDLSLADVRHVANPIAGSVVPEDLSGSLSLNARWNMSLEEPRGRARVDVRRLTVAGISADSILGSARIAGDFVTISNAWIYAGGDTLGIRGRVSLTGDSAYVDFRTDRFELTPIIQGLLPPLRQYEPAPPLPMTIPVAGYAQQVVRLPPGARGEDVNAPLTTFERLVHSHGGRPKHGYASLLPVRVDAAYRAGRRTEPGLYGTIRLLGAYMNLEYVVEPLWTPDTVIVRMNGDLIDIPEHAFRLGSQEGALKVQQLTYSFADGRYDLEAELDRATVTVIDTRPVLLPNYLRPFGFIVTPILRAWYTDPVGTFTADARLHVGGTVTQTHVWADVGLYRSLFQYPIAKPAEFFSRSSGTGAIVSNRYTIEASVATIDSLRIENNLTSNASVWLQLDVTGNMFEPNLQGRVEVSPGSRFRYLGREFSVTEATVYFRDPTRLEPEINVVAYSEFIGTSNNEPMNYRVELTATGIYPDRLRMELVAFEGGAGGEPIVNQQEVFFVLLFGVRDLRNVNFGGGSERFNTMLFTTGYATVSSALGTVIPVERISVQSKESAKGGQENVVEVAQTFRLFGQRLTVSASAPVDALDQSDPLQSTEVQWTVLERPTGFEILESLALTVGVTQGDVSQVVGSNVSDSGVQQTNADVRVRLRF